MMNDGNDRIVDIDLKKFFDTVRTNISFYNWKMEYCDWVLITILVNNMDIFDTDEEIEALMIGLFIEAKNSSPIFNLFCNATVWVHDKISSGYDALKYFYEFL